MNGTLDMVNPTTGDQAAWNDGNYVNITGGTMYLTNLNVHQGLVEISGTATATTISGVINAQNNNSKTTWNLTGGTYTTASSLNTTAIANGAVNEINLSGNINFQHGASVTAITSGDGGMTDSVTNMTLEKVYDNVNGLSGITNITTDINTVLLDGGAKAGVNAKLNVSGGTSNTVTFNLNNTFSGAWGLGANEDFYTFGGQLDLSAAATAAASNTVNIQSGRLDRGDATTASIIGSTGNTTYNIDGGTVRSINTNGGNARLINSNGRFNFTDPSSTSGGINAQNYNTRDSTAAKETITGNTSSETYNAGNYLVYTLLNIGDTVTVSTGADVRIGVIDYNDNTMGNSSRYEFEAHNLTDTINNWGYSNNIATVGGTDLQAQITADKVDVSGKLVIHENINNWGNATTASDTRNIINTLTIRNGGHVTIDRTSIHNATNDVEVHVLAGGTLSGFGYYDTTSTGLFGAHTPMRLNVDGNVTLYAGTIDGSTGRITQAGGRIQPYDDSLFELGWQTPGQVGEQSTAAVEKLMGVVFQAGEDIEFKNTSFLSTRLFAHRDTINNPQGDTHIDGFKDLYYSDAILADNIVFTDIWNPLVDVNDKPIRNTIASKIAQSLKAQYDPVFGFHYELKAKMDFELYQGNPNDDTRTYYFNVAASNSVIEELRNANGTLMPDANHLFNRMILKSDMLGEWMFDFTSDEQNIILRYRMLAEHPQNGGLVVRETERNNILPAKYLDEIRYPFLTDTSMLWLPGEYPGHIAGLPHDPSMNWANAQDPNFSGPLDPSDLYYNVPGYNGDMVAWYADPATRPAAATNYHPNWVQDWEDLLHGFQLELQSGGAGMSRGLRMLHGESYASLGESSFGVMNQFIRNRERNSVSALYQVEDPNYNRNDGSISTMFDPVLDAGRPDRFVCNPIRFWASGFGTDGKSRRSGTEYGYNQEIWGGSLGIIKEFGDLYAGLTIGYARSRNSWDAIPSAGVTKSYLAEGLLGWRLPGMLFAEAHASFSYGEQEMSRAINLANYYVGWARGDFHDKLFAGGIRVGWQKPFWGNWLFLPTVGAQVMHYRAGSFTEEGREWQANLLKVHDGSMNRTVIRTPVMARVSRAWAINGTMVLTPEIRAGFTPLLGSRRGKVKAEWVGNPFPDRTFISYGVDRGWYEAEVGASIELSRKGRFYVAGNYDLVYAKKSTMHNFSLQAGLNF